MLSKNEYIFHITVNTNTVNGMKDKIRCYFDESIGNSLQHINHSKYTYIENILVNSRRKYFFRRNYTNSCPKRILTNNWRIFFRLNYRSFRTYYSFSAILYVNSNSTIGLMITEVSLKSSLNQIYIKLNIIIM